MAAILDTYNSAMVQTNPLFSGEMNYLVNKLLAGGVVDITFIFGVKINSSRGGYGNLVSAPVCVMLHYHGECGNGIGIFVLRAGIAGVAVPFLKRVQNSGSRHNR